MPVSPKRKKKQKKSRPIITRSVSRDEQLINEYAERIEQEERHIKGLAHLFNTVDLREYLLDVEKPREC